jgi:hypothetical protein
MSDGSATATSVHLELSCMNWEEENIHEAEQTGKKLIKLLILNCDKFNYLGKILPLP